MDDVFQQQRPLLFSIAYRMLGSVAEAEDVLQEAWLRWRQTREDDVRSPRAFLATIVTRLCLDHWKSARVQRESYVGPWLPEPVPTAGASPLGPDDLLLRRESLTMAFLVLLESLSPLERAVFLLRKVFDYDYAEIAQAVDRSEEACRQLFHRANDAVAARRTRRTATREEGERLAHAFWTACQSGDLERVKGLLAEDVSSWSDSGGKRPAAMNVLRGRDTVARLVLGLLSKAPPGLRFEPVELNGCPAVIVRREHEIETVMIVEVEDHEISALRFVRNPDKLRSLASPPGSPRE